MADEVIKFSIPLDDDGFVSLQCPYCNETFKITGEVANEEDIIQLCCPYWGSTSNAVIGCKADSK